MSKNDVVLDTNVLYAGLYSSKGASYRLLRAIDEGRIKIVISTALLFEYEEILRRNSRELRLSARQIESILDSLCAMGEHQAVYYLWRPFLPDPKDDHVLELAVAASTRYIVTHNIRDFKGVDAFGIRALTPGEMLEVMK
jgi:putative PIN family toxin of toxin-antitoxin system